MADKENPKEIALEKREIAGARLQSPSTARNRDPIRDVFLAHMPKAGKILEIGAGTGEHGVHICAVAPDLTWYSGDPDAASRRSIAAWIASSGLTNMHAPHAIDVAADQWGCEADAPFDALVSINMVHIAPFEAATGLFIGAGRLLSPHGKLFLYGPFKRDGEHTAASNAAFDTSLKSRDPRWGVRDLERDILPLAQKNSLSFETVVEMPANNLSVIFRKN